MSDVLIEWLRCMTAAQIWEEEIDDIRKLQAFFDECKSKKPQFYYLFLLDENNVAKNVFWSHAS
jgi:hypothetical protein